MIFNLNLPKRIIQIFILILITTQSASWCCWAMFTHQKQKMYSATATRSMFAYFLSNCNSMNKISVGVMAVSSHHLNRQSNNNCHHHTWQLYQEKYSKGAEIYPATNNNRSFTLSDSFPDGLVPEVVSGTLLDNIDTIKCMNDVKMKTKGSKDTPQFLVSSTTKTTKAQIAVVYPISTPTLVALAALITGYVHPSYLLLTIFLSGYLVMLVILSSFSFGKQRVIDPLLLLSRMRPILPSLPPQGHVPVFVANPLGPILSKSVAYQRWLICGIVWGYILPILTVVLQFSRVCDLSSHISFRRHAITSIYLLSIQMATEAIGKHMLLPLPLRIFIPLAYNSVRMVPLYQWVMVGWTGMDLWEKVLSLVNFAYWGINLFGFLIPVASLKYFKSHFLAVEAQEVTLRERH